MRSLLCIYSLSLIFVGSAAFAEPEEEPISPTPQAATPNPSNAESPRMRKRPPVPEGATPNPTDVETPEQRRKRGAAWFNECLKDWDAATHMTKKDWQRVCRRVSVERVKLTKEEKK